MAERAIVAEGLTKTFRSRREKGVLARLKRSAVKETRALKGVTFDVGEAELFGLLGPNGAGKTTLVKILSTLLLPTGGRAFVAGHDVAKEAAAVRRKVGVVLGGERALYWRLTARENLWYFSQLYDLPGPVARPRIDHLLEEVGLADRADERVEGYSKGMKQRLHLARGLLNDPRILLLDEPTIGLDPQAGRDFRSLVKGLTRDKGVTIVLTTHYMQEADDLSDRVAILHAGEIAALDTPGALKAAYADARAFLVTARGAPADLAKRLADAVDSTLPAAVNEDPSRDAVTYRLLVNGARDHTATRLAEAVDASGAALVSLQTDEPTLEDVFVRITGERIEDAPRAP